MGLKMDGLSEFQDAFKRLRDKGEQKLDDVVKKHMEENVLPKTKELVPKKTGALEGTGRVERGTKPNSWAVKYGDSPVENDQMVDYAAAVHEIEEHKHDPPTGTKFVERPLKDSVEELKKAAADGLDELARGV